MAKCPECKSTNIATVKILKRIDGKLMETGSQKICDDCDTSFGLREFKKPRPV